MPTNRCPVLASPEQDIQAYRKSFFDSLNESVCQRAENPNEEIEKKYIYKTEDKYHCLNKSQLASYPDDEKLSLEEVVKTIKCFKESIDLDTLTTVNNNIKLLLSQAQMKQPDGLWERLKHWLGNKNQEIAYFEEGQQCLNEEITRRNTSLPKKPSQNAQQQPSTTPLRTFDAYQGLCHDGSAYCLTWQVQPDLSMKPIAEKIKKRVIECPIKPAAHEQLPDHFPVLPEYTYYWYDEYYQMNFDDPQNPSIHYEEYRIKRTLFACAQGSPKVAREIPDIHPKHILISRYVIQEKPISDPNTYAVQDIEAYIQQQPFLIGKALFTGSQYNHVRSNDYCYIKHNSSSAPKEHELPTSAHLDWHYLTKITPPLPPTPCFQPRATNQIHMADRIQLTK